MCRSGCGIGGIVAGLVETMAKGIRALAGLMADGADHPGHVRGGCCGKGRCGEGDGCGSGSTGGGCGGACASEGAKEPSSERPGCCGGCSGEVAPRSEMPVPATAPVASDREASDGAPGAASPELPSPGVPAEEAAAPSSRLAALLAIPENDLDAKLTPRQAEIIRLEREGLSNNEIAERLGLSKGTVCNHRKKARGLLGVPDAP